MTKLVVLMISGAAYLAASCSGSGSLYSCTSGSTVAQVQAAVDAVSVGGTVALAVGDYTWASPVSLTRGIKLQGAGATTVITSSGGATLVSIAPSATAQTNEETIEVSGCTFDAAGTALTPITVSGAGATASKPWRYLLIHNNTIQNGPTVTSGAGGISITGQVRGVIHHNTFDRMTVVLKNMGNDSTSEWTNSAYVPFAYGSADNLFFEDNTIQFSSSYSATDAGWIESGHGARLVLRKNTYNFTNNVGGCGVAGCGEMWDNHGFQNWPGGQTGTMVAEYYGNTATAVAVGKYYWLNHRGSWAMVFDNTITSTGAAAIIASQYADGCAGNVTPTPVGYSPEINNTYAFNNLRNGSRVDMTINLGGCGIAENANFWNQATSFNGTIGVGRGAAASRPATCTTGVGYWATDEGEWDSTHAGVDGRFYKCTATNTWTMYYTPYTYPHPLQGAVSTGNGAPPTKVSVRIVW